MEKSHYQQIPQNRELHTKLQYKDTDWKPFLRQLLIGSGVCTASFIFGLIVGAPTVIIPQIRREANSTEIISDDMASWLTSVFSISGFPFVIIITIATKYIGRKICQIITVTDAVVAFTLYYCSTKVTHILISNIILGLFCVSQTTLNILILTEYISPKYRGIFLTAKVASVQWGMWTSNAIGTFFHWKIIPLFGIVGSLYTLFTASITPESPFWLASRGKFEECAVSHRTLKGCCDDSEKELEALINCQKQYIASCGATKPSARQRVAMFLKINTSKEFYKPTILSCMTIFLGFCSGKLIFAVYAIEVFTKITGSEKTAYTVMLTIDGFTVLSMYGGCILSKVMKRRTLLLYASGTGVVLLFVMSLYLYLISLNVILENKYVTTFLFVAFSCSGGPLAVCMLLQGELIPVRSRNLGICYNALFTKIIMGFTLKLAPLFFSTFGFHGACLTLGIVSSITMYLLFRYLPETKDKTLQEIADSMHEVKPIRGEYQPE